MPRFVIQGDCLEILAGLFQQDADGRLFVAPWAAVSESPAVRGDLLEGPIRFGCHLMEVGVFCTVEAADLDPGCRLTIRGEGSPQDYYLLAHWRRLIKCQSGLSVSSESDG